MEKIRFSCPRCATVMQTNADRINDEVACPQCRHQFRLVEGESGGSGNVNSDAPTMPPQRRGFSNGSSPDNAPTSWQPPSKPNGGAQPMQNAVPPMAGAFSAPHAQPHSQPQGFCCPYCRTTQPPRWKSEVSQTGWLVFAILLLTTCFFCWIGLLIKDRYRVCSQCKVRLE